MAGRPALPTHCIRQALKQTLSEATCGGGSAGSSAELEMPPKAKQKMRYNWRARQSGLNKSRSHSATRAGKAGGREACQTPSEDTNALVLPSRPAKPPREAEDGAPKRRRLSSKQRKRLMKVLEAKEKKAKACSF